MYTLNSCNCLMNHIFVSILYFSHVIVCLDFRYCHRQGHIVIVRNILSSSGIFHRQGILSSSGTHCHRQWILSSSGTYCHLQGILSSSGDIVVVMGYITWPENVSHVAMFVALFVLVYFFFFF